MESFPFTGSFTRNEFCLNLFKTDQSVNILLTSIRKLNISQSLEDGLSLDEHHLRLFEKYK